MPDRPFMDPDEISAFARDRARFSREVLAVNGTGRPSPEPLEAMVTRHLGDKGFRCVGIEVLGDDGMSWAAHVADTVVAESAPRATRMRLRGGAGSAAHPELEQILSPRKIAVIAQKNGLVKSARLLGRRRYAVTVAGAIAVGAVGSVLGVTFAGHGFSEASLTLPLVIALVAVAALAVLGQLLIETLRPESHSSPLARAAEDIAAEARRERLSDNFRHFIYDLAAELRRPSDFRCLIVDDFTSLDIISRMVLQYYLEFFAESSRRELWIIFCSAEDKWLRVTAAGRMKGERAPYGFRRIVMYLLDHLSAAKGKELAAARGVAWRGYHTVGAIVRGDSRTALTDFFEQEHNARAQLVDGIPVGEILDFFYVLALNVVPEHNPWMHASDIRSNFSRKSRRSRILALLMRGRYLSATEIAQYLRLASDRYFPLAGSVAGENEGGTRFRRFLVAPEASECLESSWQDLGLPNPSIVHLFWALYWADRELHGPANIAVLPLICAHLLQSAAPTSIKKQIADTQADFDAFTDDLFNTVLELVRACLKLCLLGDVRGLLEYALRLVEDDREQVERRRRARLRPLAWQAYGLLGDEKLLAIILEFQQAAPARRPGGDASGHDLTYLYLQSIPGEDADTRELMSAELSRSDAALHSGGYARARAGWLMAGIAPFLSAGMSSLLEVAEDAQERMPEIVQGSVAALESVAEEGEWHTTDVLDVLIGLWALALISEGTRAPNAGWELTASRAAKCVDLLSQSYLLGADLAKQRQSIDSSPETLDFVLDCLAQELLTVVLAAGVLMLSRWPAAIWSETVPREDVVEVVSESGRVLGMSEHMLIPPGGSPDRELIEELSRHMTLLAVLWRGLKFDQQAAFMAIRLGQFRAVLIRQDAQLAESVMELLATEMKHPAHVGLLAHLTTAEAAMASEQLEAEWLNRASKATIKGLFADRLAAELCAGAIDVGHAYDIDFSECLDFLLKPWIGESALRLGTLLSDISDNDMTDFTMAILNILHDDTADRVDRVSELLDTRIADVADPAVKKTITGLFRTFTLRRHIAAKQSVDVSVELNEWQALKEIPEYAYLLSILFPIAPRGTHDRLIAESVAVLEDVQAYMQNTGYVFLAMELIHNVGHSSDAGAVALRALERGFNHFERALSVDGNIAVLNILKQVNATKYQPKYFEWHKIMLEVDVTKRLPQLVDQGRYFLLIWHYFQLFADYQLQSEPPVSQYGLDDTEMTQALREWQSANRIIPEPIIRSGTGIGLSGDFLRFGYALFYATPAKVSLLSLTEAEIEDARQQFDHRARGVIDVLYQMLRRLPAIPESVKQIVRRHEVLVRSMLDSQLAAD